MGGWVRGRHRVARVMVVVSVVAGAACDSAAARGPQIDAVTCRSSSAPHQSQASSSLPALANLAAKEHTALSGTLAHSGHGRAGPQQDISWSGPSGAMLARQVRAAAQVACEFRTVDAAVRAGYAQSSVFDEGVGVHWTNWRLVDAPFDPTRPAMLLYAPRLGRMQLVGFSYWVRTTNRTGPDGFAGDADRWHRHYGLCFDRAGLLQRENVRAPALCRGTYINGADMWMLHTWVVPGAPNVWGLFAELNPQLCNRNAPDIARCPGFE
jgi:hypothetical protein